MPSRVHDMGKREDDMKRIGVFIVLGALVVVSGCSSVRVRHDYDREFDFSSFYSFAWVALPEAPSDSVQEEMMRNPLVARRIKGAVKNQLALKGIVLNLENPDFLIAFHSGVEKKISVTGWGYHYPPRYRYWGWAGNNIQVHQYRSGTLILDFIDPRSQELVWRGVSEQTLPKSPTAEQLDKTISKGIKKILEKFPPN